MYDHPREPLEMRIFRDQEDIAKHVSATDIAEVTRERNIEKKRRVKIIMCERLYVEIDDVVKVIVNHLHK